MATTLPPQEEGIPPLHAQILRTAGEFDLREFGRVIIRRKMIIATTVIAVTFLTIVGVFQIVPLYATTVKVMLEGRQAQIVDVQAVLSGLPAGAPSTIQSEIQVITSRTLARRIIQRLDLDKNPEFNGALVPRPAWKAVFNPASYIPSWLKFSTEKKITLTDEERKEREMVGVVDAFESKLSVQPEGRSLVINITFKSRDPRLAAEVANALADGYIVSQLEAKFEATRRATAWLNERLVGLREEIVVAEGAVEAYRKNSGLIKGKNVNLSSEEVSELNTMLVQARTRRADAEARLRQVRQLLESEGGIESVAEVLNSSLIQRLREQEAELERKTAELSMEYGELHPKMINIRAELSDLHATISAEVGKVIQGIRNEVAVERSREASLKENLRKLKVEVSRKNEAEVNLRALEREANATRTLFETFLERFKETSAQENFQQPDAALISKADIPSSPSYPKKRLIVLLAMIGSSVLGLLLAFGAELLDLGFRSMEQVERVMGVPPLGLVPALKNVASPDTFVLQNLASAYSESIRSLNTNLLLSNVDRPPKVILITSALPNEGKSLICTSLAHLLSSVGQKVVVVDCDLRRPTVHSTFGVPSQPGLVEFLAGKSTLEEVINKDQNSRAHIIPAGSSAPNPPDLLSSGHMRRLLKGLADAYDLVILDSAPVVAISDTKVLGRLVDKTVFVVRWAYTRREVAMSGLRQLIDSGADVSGVLLSQVDVKKHAQYGYGDSGYYHGQVKKYYSS